METHDQSAEQRLQDIFNFADTNTFLPLFSNMQLWRDRIVPVTVELHIGISTKMCSVILTYDPNGERPFISAQDHNCQNVWQFLRGVAQRGTLMPMRPDEDSHIWKAVAGIVGYEEPAA